jgi:hypothetical protein
LATPGADGYQHDDGHGYGYGDDGDYSSGSLAHGASQ